jgi:hypothetical protein
MLMDRPGSINKWIKRVKPGTLVEALKVTSKEIHAWEEEGQRTEEELRRKINEGWDKLTSYEKAGATFWNELCGMQKKYWELCAELYPPVDEELNIEVFSSEEFREVFREQLDAEKIVGLPVPLAFQPILTSSSPIKGEKLAKVIWAANIKSE